MFSICQQQTEHFWDLIAVITTVAANKEDLPDLSQNFLYPHDIYTPKYEGLIKKSLNFTLTGRIKIWFDMLPILASLSFPLQRYTSVRGWIRLCRDFTLVITAAEVTLSRQ